MTFKINPVHHEDIVEHQAFCGLPFTKCILNADGNVSTCCYQLEQLGSLIDDEILDIWNSPRAQAIRESTMKGELHSICKSWNVCPFLVREKEPVPFKSYKKFTYPTYLEICLPDSHCNIGGLIPSDEKPACIMCIRNHRKPKQEDLTGFLCDKARPIMPFLKHLCVLGIAEPFWKDQVFQVFEWLEFPRYRDQIRFETNTNATLLIPKINERFFAEVGWSDISFSIDAATPDTFIKIRRIDAYNNIIKNIKNYMELREEHGGKERHITTIWNNINLLNVSEMTDMVETAADLGVDKMVMLPTHDQNGNVSLGEILLNHKNVEIFERNADKAMQRAIDLNVPLTYPKPFNCVPPPVENARSPNELVQISLKS